jgi:hypothetical protein
MMSGPHTDPTVVPATSLAEPGQQPLRLKLKPVVPPADRLDGAWWPRSRDVATEVPALAEALATRLGQITGVAFAISAWNPAPPRIDVDGHLVRLEGVDEHDENVVRVSGPDRQRLRLLVVPPEATGTTGDDAMLLASRPVEADWPAEILAVSGARPAPLIPGPRPDRDLGSRGGRRGRIRTWLGLVGHLTRGARLHLDRAVGGGYRGRS